jgi:hypothetical protein
MAAAPVGLPVWTAGVWADTVWEEGVWASEVAEATRTRTGLYSHLSHIRRRARRCMWILFNLIGV